MIFYRHILRATCALLLTVALPLSAWAAPVRQFPDVPVTSPEFRQITKLSAQGVINGRDNGSFSPADPVKHLEALVMAMRFFNYAGTAETSAHLLSKETEAQFGGNVPTWGKGYIVTAINQNIIDPAENRAWDAGASRAWVARLLVQMLGYQSQAEALAAETTTFPDAATIPAWAKGYIVKAVQLGLIRGYEDGTFQPNRTVSRSEMAIFLDRAEAHMTGLPLNINEATVIAANDTGLSVLNETNLLTNLTLSSNCRIFSKGRPATAGDLKAQDRIRYIKDNDQVVYLEVYQAGSALINVVKGEVIHLNQETGLLSIRAEDGTPRTFALAAGIKVLTLFQQAVTTSNLTVGAKVQVHLNNEGKAATILLEEAGQKGSQGTITELDLTNKILILSDAGNHFLTYYIGENVDLEYEGRRFTSLADLRQGDLVAVDTDAKNMVTAIKVIQPQSRLTITGTVALLAKDTRILTVKTADGQLLAYELPSGVTLEFANGTGAMIDELFAQDPVTLYLQGGTVQRVVLDKTGETRGIWGKIVSVDQVRRLLVVKDREDRLMSYEIKDPVILDIEGNNDPTLSDLTVDTIILFELDKDMIDYIKVDNTVEGTVERVESSRNLLTLRDLAGNLTNYAVSPNVDVELYGRAGETLSDVTVNDRVKIRLKNDRIVQIQIHGKTSGRVTDTTVSTNRIYLTDLDDKEHIYTVNNDLKLVIPGITNPRVSDIERNQWAVVAYWGDDPYCITIQRPVTGEVTGVDASHERITVRHYDGTAKTYNLAAEFKVEKAGTTSTYLSTVETKDRIQLVLDEQDQVFRAYVARKVSGQVDGINRSTKTIYLQGVVIGYDIDDNTTIHRNGARKTFDDILQKQNITIYYTTGFKAIEVALPNN